MTRAAGLTLLAALFSVTATAQTIQPCSMPASVLAQSQPCAGALMAQTIPWPDGHPCRLPQAQRPSWCPADPVQAPTATPTQPAVQATPTPRATPPSGTTPTPGAGGATPTPIDATAQIRSATITIQKVAVGAYRYDGTGQLVTREGWPVTGLCFEFTDGSRLPCSGAIKR